VKTVFSPWKKRDSRLAARRERGSVMVNIVALGDREVLAMTVNGEHLHPGNVERINAPEAENPYWEIELNDGTILMATGSVTVYYKTVA
jgi:hypothetical protein